jgi:hypothetical protein
MHGPQGPAGGSNGGVEEEEEEEGDLEALHGREKSLCFPAWTSHPVAFAVLPLFHSFDRNSKLHGQKSYPFSKSNLFL